ncbi:MAG: hypothetical protein O3C21_12525 [Verrucomicrobia bacterium]|nr:hypothetical protein [Verrucomicrobiota bacterium]
MIVAATLSGIPPWTTAQDDKGAALLPDLKIEWQKNILRVKGDFPGGAIDIWYLEAYCRPGSTDRDWNETVIKHETTLKRASDDHREIDLECRIADGVIVNHAIRVTEGGLTFDITATNPTDKISDAHWAQPCIRVGDFTGTGEGTHPNDKYAYLAKSFLFVDGQLEHMPTRRWALSARYEPGQVWCPAHVDRNDVNPRPLSPIVPSNGLIGCFSKDDTHLMAVAFEPYQELFQGVIRCLHSDFRIGGLAPGESKTIHGKLYLMEADVEKLLRIYATDFPKS